MHIISVTGDGDGYEEGDGHSHGYVHCLDTYHFLHDFYEYEHSEKSWVGDGQFGVGAWWLICLPEVLPMLVACDIGVDLALSTRLQCLR